MTRIAVVEAACVWLVFGIAFAIWGHDVVAPT